MNRLAFLGLSLLTLLWGMAAGGGARAAILAHDVASNAAYNDVSVAGDGWQLTGGRAGLSEAPAYVPQASGDNGGSGFGTWSAAGSYTFASWSTNNTFYPAAHFIDTTGLAENDLGADAFAMSGQTNAGHNHTIGTVRPFAAPLNVGDTVSLDYDNPPQDPLFLPTRLIGISFENAAGSKRFQLVLQPSNNLPGSEDEEWYWQPDTGSVNDIGGANVASGMDTSDGTSLSVTVTSSTTANLVFDGAAAAVSWTNTDPITQLRVWTQNLLASADGSEEVFFNNLKIEGVATGLPGDYNQNGVIDAADYTVWRDKLGGTIPNDPTGGVATAADYDYWKAHFGEPGGAGASRGASAGSAVPEPSSVLLLAIGLGLGLGSSRKHVVRRRP